jgi:hypothetical protein
VFVLYKDRRPFFELDTHPTSEEIESLRKTRTKKQVYTFTSLRMRENGKID